eukprot:6217291-Amphidinium_carterae.1
MTGRDGAGKKRPCNSVERPLPLRLCPAMKLGERCARAHTTCEQNAHLIPQLTLNNGIQNERSAASIIVELWKPDERVK